MAAVRHIALFRFNDEATPEQQAEALRLLRGLVTSPGILSWEVEPSFDTRRGTVVAVNGLFADEEALTTFRPSPDHQAVARYMRDLATWLVADYYVKIA